MFGKNTQAEHSAMKTLIFCSCSILTIFGLENPEMVITGTIPSLGWMVNLHKTCPLGGLYRLYLLRLKMCWEGQWLLTLECDSMQQSLDGGMEESEFCH